MNQDLSRPPPKPIIVKVGETKQLDVYSDEWWFTATVNTISNNYIHIQFDEWDNNWDKWAYFPDGTDFLIFNRLYKYQDSPPKPPEEECKSNDYNNMPPPPSPIPKYISFAPLNTYTVSYKRLNKSPFGIERKPMYYYSKCEGKSYLITVSNDGIYKYDIHDNTWSLMVRPPIYLNKHKVCMDEINGKLYFLSKETFGIFDIETLKWNAIQRIHHESPIMESFGINRSSITRWGRNNYKTEIESFICVHDTDNIDIDDDIDDDIESQEETKNDGIQWFDEQLNRWRDGLILNENKEKNIIKIKYSIMDNDGVCIGMNKFDNLNDIIIKRETKDYMIDNDLKIKMNNLTFHAIYREFGIPAFTESLVFKWNKGRMTKLIPEYKQNINYRICDGVIYDSKLLFIKRKQMLMLFGGRNGASTELTNIWYKILGKNNQWNKHKNILPYNKNEYTDIILVKNRIIIFFCFGFGEIYCYDLINGNWIKHIKTFDIPFKCPIMAVYDNKNDFVHLLSKSGYHIKYHLKIKIYQLIPTQMFRMEMIIGFLRISEIEHSLIIPYSLYDIIIMYYPKYDDIKPYTF